MQVCVCVWQLSAVVGTCTFTVTLPVFSVAAFYLGHCYNLHTGYGGGVAGEGDEAAANAKAVPIQAATPTREHLHSWACMHVNMCVCVRKCMCVNVYSTFKCNFM